MVLIHGRLLKSGRNSNELKISFQSTQRGLTLATMLIDPGHSIPFSRTNVMEHQPFLINVYYLLLVFQFGSLSSPVQSTGSLAIRH